jgi:hypothetical protein
MLTLKQLDTIRAPILKKHLQNDSNYDHKYSKYKKITNSGTNWTLFHKDDINFAITQLEWDEACTKFDKTINQLDAILRVNRANTTYKKVSGSHRRALEREPCAICFETHDAKQLTTTNCGHTFCRPCFSKVIDTYYYENKEIVCPYCRNDKITLTRYYK